MLTHHPGYTLVHNTRCSLLIKLNRTDEFVRACELAVLKNPYHPDTYLNLGVAYTKLGDLSRAETAFRRMLMLDQSNVVGMYKLASVLQASRQTQALLEAREL